MPGHAGGRQGLLPDQQELCQRPAGAGTPPLWGQDDGGERSAVGGLIFGLCHVYSKKDLIVIDYIFKKNPRC